MANGGQSLREGIRLGREGGDPFSALIDSVREGSKKREEQEALKRQEEQELASGLEKVFASLGVVTPKGREVLGLDEDGPAAGAQPTTGAPAQFPRMLAGGGIVEGAAPLVGGTGQPLADGREVRPTDITQKNRFTGTTIKGKILPTEEERKQEQARKTQAGAEETFAKEKAKVAGKGELPTKVLISESAAEVDKAISRIFELTGNDPENISFKKAVEASTFGRIPLAGKGVRFAKEMTFKDDPLAQRITLALDIIENEFVTSKGGKQLTRTEIEFIQRRLPSLRRTGEINFEALRELQSFVRRVKRRLDGAESLGFAVTEEGFEKEGQTFTAEQIDSLLGPEVTEDSTPTAQEASDAKGRGAVGFDEDQGIFVDAQGNEV